LARETATPAGLPAYLTLASTMDIEGADALLEAIQACLRGAMS